MNNRFLLKRENCNNFFCWCLLSWSKDIQSFFFFIALYIYIFVVALSFSLHILNWRVLSFESACDFHIFFPRLIAWFSCAGCVYVKEKKRLCAYVYCRLFAQLRLLVLICNVFIFVLSLKKRQKRDGERKRCKKDIHRIFVDFLFLFSSSSFLKYSFSFIFW